MLRTCDWRVISGWERALYSRNIILATLVWFAVDIGRVIRVRVRAVESVLCFDVVMLWGLVHYALLI